MVVIGSFCLLPGCGGGGGQGGGAGGGGGGGPDAGQESLTVTLTSPESDVFTRGVVNLGAAVDGGMPDSVTLVVDSAVIATLIPPYQYTWDTTTVLEGRHEVRARATLGHQAFTSAPRVVTVDRTPPRVVSHTPTAGNTNVSIHDPITVEFSEPILPATITASSVGLAYEPFAPIPMEATLSADGMHLTITPRDPLTVGQELTGYLTADVTDLAGNPLQKDDWGWSMPDWLRLGDPLHPVPDKDSLNPVIAIDPDGNPVVAFASGDEVDVFRLINGKWQPIGGPLTSRDTAGTVLALDSSGQPFVAFTDFDGLQNKVLVRRWTGSAWEAVGGTGFAVFSLDDSRNFAMSVDALDHPVLAFQDRGRVSVQRWTGTVWQSLGGAFGNRAQPPLGLALDGSGEPVVVYSDTDGISYGVRVLEWDGAEWHLLTAPNAVSGSVPSEASLAVSRNGMPVVAFEEGDGMRFNVYVEQWAIAIHHLEWQPVGPAINAVAQQSAVDPSLVLDANDNPVVAFVEFDGIADAVYVQRWNGTTSGLVGSIHDPGGIFIPRLALDGSDRPVLAFDERDGSKSKVYVFRLNR
jgi:hypothetical protein